jgi:hypothetical protein
MNWVALGAIAEAIAALAFLGSFLFVKQQMKQNHEMTKAGNQREILNALRDFFALTRSDQEQFHAVAKCLKEYEAADVRSRHIFTMWVVDFMLIAEQAWYMRRDGYINEASYNGVENLCLAILITEGGQKIWPSIKDSWGQDVSDHMQTCLQRAGRNAPKVYEVFPYF